MFYSQLILAKKGPLARVWLAAHWDKKLTKAQVFQTDISDSVQSIMHPAAPLALRLSGHLLLGVVRIYSRRVGYVMSDCNEALVKIKMAFRPGVVDLPVEAAVAHVTTVAIPTFDELDAPFPDADMLDGALFASEDWMAVALRAPEPARSLVSSQVSERSDRRRSVLETPASMEERRRGRTSAGFRDSLAHAEAPMGVEQFESMVPFREIAPPDFEEHPGFEPAMPEDFPLLPPSPDHGVGPDVPPVSPPLVGGVGPDMEMEPEPAPEPARRKRRVVLDRNTELPSEVMKRRTRDATDVVRPRKRARVLPPGAPTTIAETFAQPSWLSGAAPELSALFAAAVAPEPLPYALVAAPEPAAPAPPAVEEAAAAPEAARGAAQEAAGVEEEHFGFDMDFDEAPIADVSMPGLPEPAPVSPLPGPQAAGPAAVETLFPREPQTTDELRTAPDYTRSTMHRHTVSMLKLLNASMHDQASITFSDLTQRASRQDAARAFLQVLVLKTRNAVSVRQDAPYEEIHLARGPELDAHLRAIAT